MQFYVFSWMLERWGKLALLEPRHSSFGKMPSCFHRGQKAWVSPAGSTAAPCCLLEEESRVKFKVNGWLGWTHSSKHVSNDGPGVHQPPAYHF